MQSAGITDHSRVLIAGATSDFGQALLPYLVSCPIRLGLHGYRSVERISSVNERATADVQIFTGPLDTGETAERLVTDFVDWAGGIDILVQLTGNICNPESWETVNEDDWNTDLAVNLTAPFFLARSAAKQMHDGGRIVLMGTASARHGGGGTTLAYGVAKAGIETVTKGLAKFTAPRGILVNAVCPGFIDTRFQTEKAGKTPADLARRAEFVPLKRAGEASDVARAILFLMSTDNRFVTGQCFDVDGGDFI